MRPATTDTRPASCGDLNKNAGLRQALGGASFGSRRLHSAAVLNMLAAEPSPLPGVHMATTLPDYVKASVPNPPSNRGPWYKNTAPSYAGIFLWVAFYLGLAGPTISQASLGVSLLGLFVAGVLCFALYYYAPAMLGMQTGRPLYVVGSSTFGTAGGYVMPGLLMGVLQLGWFAVATYFATDYILQG